MSSSSTSDTLRAFLPPDPPDVALAVDLGVLVVEPLREGAAPSFPWVARLLRDHNRQLSAF